MTELAVLVTALLFGGTMLYAFGFAAFVFTALPAETAGGLIRRAFPHFYLFVLATSGFAAGLALPGDRLSSLLLVVVALTTLIARERLMPAINRATDTGAARRFRVLHTLSVLITLTHIVLAGIALLRLAGAI